MKPVNVYSRNGKVQHLVDGDRYTHVSRSRSLCGLSGKAYHIPAAAYYWGMHWPVCKKCKRIADKEADNGRRK